MVRCLGSEYHTTKLQVAEVLLLPDAKKGELWAIQNLLLISSEAIREKCPLTDGIADYISCALAAIHNGEKADAAFGIRRKRGEKDNRASRMRAYSMADCVERLRYHKNGMTLELAIEEVAPKFSAAPDTVKLAWKKNYKDVRRMFELERKYGAVQEVMWPR